MFCEKCGAQLEDDASFCSHCGTPVTRTEGFKTEAEPAPQSEAQATPEMQPEAMPAEPQPIPQDQPQAQPAPAPVQTATNTLAIVGFVLSFFVSLAGLICSCIGLKKANTEFGGNGKGLAIAGIVIGAVGLFATVVVLGIYGCALCVVIAGGGAGSFV